MIDVVCGVPVMALKSRRNPSPKYIPTKMKFHVRFFSIEITSSKNVVIGLTIV